MRKLICPFCGKELIPLEPYQDGKASFWCDCRGVNIEINPDEETPVSISNNRVRVDWYNAGEGICGDYNPDNPDDINLLRFDVYWNPNRDSHENEVSWEEMEDASYCTQIPAETDTGKLVERLSVIFNIYDDIIDGYPEFSYKKLGESLSWISL